MKSTNIKHCVLGLGEVGSALKNVLKADGFDPRTGGLFRVEKYDVIHICFPYNKEFENNVRSYQRWLKPTHTVIHSSVPVGTSDKLNAIHSPIRGVHPHLEKGIRTFVKYFGGKGAQEIANMLKAKGIKVCVVKSSRTTEALKLLDTTQYGLLILLNKLIKWWCDRNGIDFDIAYTHANATYNEGYLKLKRNEVVRPYLAYRNEKIGGHCVNENARLIKGPLSWPLRIYDFYKKTMGFLS